MRRISKCRYCQAPVLWAYYAYAGRVIPFDEEPQPDGMVELTFHPDPMGENRAKWVPPQERKFHDNLYRQHQCKKGVRK